MNDKPRSDIPWLAEMIQENGQVDQPAHNYDAALYNEVAPQADPRAFIAALRSRLAAHNSHVTQIGRNVESVDIYEAVTGEPSAPQTRPTTPVAGAPYWQVAVPPELAETIRGKSVAQPASRAKPETGERPQRGGYSASRAQTATRGENRQQAFMPVPPAGAPTSTPPSVPGEPDASAYSAAVAPADIAPPADLRPTVPASSPSAVTPVAPLGEPPAGATPPADLETPTEPGGASNTGQPEVVDDSPASAAAVSPTRVPTGTLADDPDAAPDLDGSAEQVAPDDGNPFFGPVAGASEFIRQQPKSVSYPGREPVTEQPVPTSAPAPLSAPSQAEAKPMPAQRADELPKTEADLPRDKNHEDTVSLAFEDLPPAVPKMTNPAFVEQPYGSGYAPIGQAGADEPEETTSDARSSESAPPPEETVVMPFEPSELAPGAFSGVGESSGQAAQDMPQAKVDGTGSRKAAGHPDRPATDDTVIAPFEPSELDTPFTGPSAATPSGRSQDVFSVANSVPAGLGQVFSGPPIPPAGGSGTPAAGLPIPSAPPANQDLASPPGFEARTPATQPVGGLPVPPPLPAVPDQQENTIPAANDLDRANDTLSFIPGFGWQEADEEDWEESDPGSRVGPEAKPQVPWTERYAVLETPRSEPTQVLPNNPANSPVSASYPGLDEPGRTATSGSEPTQVVPVPDATPGGQVPTPPAGNEPTRVLPENLPTAPGAASRQGPMQPAPGGGEPPRVLPPGEAPAAAAAFGQYPPAGRPTRGVPASGAQPTSQGSEPTVFIAGVPGSGAEPTTMLPTAAAAILPPAQAHPGATQGYPGPVGGQPGNNHNQPRASYNSPGQTNSYPAGYHPQPSQDSDVLGDTQPGQGIIGLNDTQPSRPPVAPPESPGLTGQFAGYAVSGQPQGRTPAPAVNNQTSYFSAAASSAGAVPEGAHQAASQPPPPNEPVSSRRDSEDDDSAGEWHGEPRWIWILIGSLVLAIVLITAWLVHSYLSASGITADPTPQPPSSQVSTPSSQPSSVQPSTSPSRSSTPSPQPTSSASPSSSTSTRTPKATPKGWPVAGSTECSSSVAVNSHASCDFANNVAAAFDSSGPGTITAHSPVTGKDYELTCEAASTDGLYICTGGNDAKIYIR